MFAATDEELATLIELPDDPKEAAEVRRRVQTGDIPLRWTDDPEADECDE